MTKYEKYENIILNSIDSDGFEGEPYHNPCETAQEKAQFSRGRFMSEYGWNVERKGEFKALTEWLAGLALNIPYNNCDILELAGAENMSEKAQDKILNNYFKFMAMRLLKIWRDYA